MFLQCETIDGVTTWVAVAAVVRVVALSSGDRCKLILAGGEILTVRGPAEMVVGELDARTRVVPKISPSAAAQA